MSIGVRLFHSRKNLKNYILVKPTENKCFLYSLNKDGTISDINKPVLKKTYEKYQIVREGKFPSDDLFQNFEHRYHVWKSTMPRNINKIPEGRSQRFSIQNKDGDSGLSVNIGGSIGKKGVTSVDKMQFPLGGFDSSGITNLARIYLRKIFAFYSSTRPNSNTYYISDKLDEYLTKLDNECEIPNFEVTVEIKNSIKKLCEKYNIQT